MMARLRFKDVRRGDRFYREDGQKFVVERISRKHKRIDVYTIHPQLGVISLPLSMRELNAMRYERSS